MFLWLHLNICGHVPQSEDLGGGSLGCPCVPPCSAEILTAPHDSLGAGRGGGKIHRKVFQVGRILLLSAIMEQIATLVATLGDGSRCD